MHTFFVGAAFDEIIQKSKATEMLDRKELQAQG
jgi:hypothetical protein